MRTRLTRRELLVSIAATAAACRGRGANETRQQDAESTTVTFTVDGMV